VKINLFIKQTNIFHVSLSVREIYLSVPRLLVTTNVVPSSVILVTLMMEAIRSSETSVLTRAARRNITEDRFLRSHRRENLKSYMIQESLFGRECDCSSEIATLQREPEGMR
jgi:hypothetical protein